MKIGVQLLGLLALTTTTTLAQDCATDYLDAASPLDEITLSYTADTTAGVLRAKVEYAGQGWVGFAVSEAGGMVGSHAVLGLPADSAVGRYVLGGKVDELVTPLPIQEGLVGTITQNETHSVLEFEVSLEDPNDAALSIDPNGANNFLVAAGSGNELTYHAIREPLTVTLTPCESGAAAQVAATDAPMEDEAAATDAPMEDEVAATDAPMEDEAAATDAPMEAEPAATDAPMEEEAEPDAAAAATGGLMIGDTVEHEGFVIDRFCIDQGVFLDQPNVASLANPDKHTLHCLIDAPPCIASVYELLAEPAMQGDNYTRSYVLDEDSKALVVEAAKELGSETCTECNGVGHLHKGFRVAVTATVTALADDSIGAGPTISVTDVSAIFPFVGQGIELDAYISDQYCLQRGTFLDNDLPSLEQPEAHTIHCLIDPPPCIASPFEVLVDPMGDEDMYTRGYTLDDKSKNFFVNMIKIVGVCEQCTGNGVLVEGFRSKLWGTIQDAARNETSGGGPLVAVSNAQPILPDTWSQDITIEGYVTDRFCIEQGTFLDTGLVTLENIEKHTLHCLLDPPPCLESPFEIMVDPDVENGETLWTRGFTLDEAGKQRVIELGREIGDCETCSGGETGQKAGFRVLIQATIVDPVGNVTAGSGPVISIRSVEVVIPEVLPDEPDVMTDAPEVMPETPDDAECAVDSGPTTIDIEDHPITLTYELGTDEDSGMATFSGTVVYEGQGWLAFGISEAGKMVGSLAVIGLPDEGVSQTNPGKYNLAGQIVQEVSLTDQQTLLDGNIEQNETHTVLTFTKFLEEEGELSINPTGENFFLVAYGSSNELAFHLGRQPFSVFLGCPAEPEPPLPNLAVGDVVSIEGFVMDNFCIERGTLLDEPQIVTLEQPNLHTLHCLIDIQSCNSSNYEILMDPLPGTSLFRRALTLDDESKAQIQTMAKELGSCDICSGRRLQGGAGLERGFRASVTAEVMDLGNTSTGAPPMVALSDVTPVLFVTDASTVVSFEAGDLVTVTGFIMDNFCIERGTLFDAPTIVSLQEPNLHSLHCLIDVPQCNASNYEVLLDPVPGMEDPMYTRGFVLDDTAKAFVRTLAKEVGVCDDCDGTGTWEFGFRAKIQGTILELGSDGEPPLISVQMATPIPLEGAMAADATEAPAVTAAPNANDGPVDCSEFQSTLDYPGTGITLDYVVVVDEETGVGNFSGQVIFEGQGWVGFAISEEGNMVGSLALIGLPDEGVSQTNPGKYDLAGQSVSAVSLTDQQTLLDGNIEQNETHTVLTFTKLLSEPNEIAIDPNGVNFFLVAAGSSNDLNIHQHRAAAQVALAPCTPESGGAAGGAIAIEDGRRQSHYKAHGWLLLIAWGLFVPLAIANSLCRHLIPVQGLWFEMHRGLNSLAIILTIIGFSIIVNELQQNTPQPDHFQPTDGAGAIGKHKTIGLVVFLTAILQGIGGFMRPHVPDKLEDGTPAPKSSIRVFWEFAHKLSGVAILAMAWYQCHTGLVIYAANFQADDYSDVFWGVTGTISAIAVVGGLSRFVMPETEATNHSPVPNQEVEDKMPNQEVEDKM